MKQLLFYISMRILKLILTALNPAEEAFLLISYQKIKLVISRKEFINFKYDNICNKYKKNIHQVI